MITTLVFGSLHLLCKRTWRVGVDSYLRLQPESFLFPFLKISLSLSLATIGDVLVSRNSRGDTKPPRCGARPLACLEACYSARLRRGVQRCDETRGRRFVGHCPTAVARQRLHDSQQAHLISARRSSRSANARCARVLYRVPANEDSFPLRKRPLPQKANNPANPARSRIRIEQFKERRNTERKNAL